MGRDNRFTGSIEIDPPLPWSQIRHSPFLPDSQLARRGADVKFMLRQEQEDTPDGILTRTSAVAIVPTSDGVYSGYNLPDNLQQIANTHPNHAFRGHIERINLDQGDRSRYKIVDGHAREYEPEIRWPDEAQ